MLSAVVERLLNALRQARPTTVRQFLALACPHLRWELNDRARRLVNQPTEVALHEASLPAPAGSDSGLSPDARRMPAAITNLPAGEREGFDLVRIQGLPQAEAARLLGVSAGTVKRRLHRSLVLLAKELEHLRPEHRAQP
jgi:RNA polymerase sigma-70 factor (ECF subfamily)